MASVDSPTGSRAKRLRAARACQFCRAKKYRCDERQPCSKCRRWNVSCVYEGFEHRRRAFENDSRADLDRAWVDQDTPHVLSHSDRISSLESNNRPRDAAFDGAPDATQSPMPDDSDRDMNSEVNEVNVHTSNTEFHGPTSSLAFLAAVHRQSRNRAAHSATPTRTSPPLEQQTQSLVSTFHNETFLPTSMNNTGDEDRTLSASRFYFHQSQLFLDGYFQNLHFIHPIVDKLEFLGKCEDLWFGKSGTQPRTFIALYYAIMSLGALIREWDEGEMENMNRFGWSRKMFKLASLALGGFPGKNDLETVQTYLILAKVCQNELNPHLAYMYLGHATRMSLSAGYNRASPQRRQPCQSSDTAISRTWWGLYSLEMETSFALGRPDSLGQEIYHTRPYPPIDQSQTAMLTCMVHLANIIRKVSTSVYLSGGSVFSKAETATKLEYELDHWLNTLPEIIRPQALDHLEQDNGIKTRRPQWANRQSHTLKFRYYNVKMVLYRPFLSYIGRSGNPTPAGFDSAVKSCISAARSTIELMHFMFCNFSYFRSWWYNTTYTLYAASIVLFYANNIALASELPDLVPPIQMSIDVLTAMEENEVAKKAAALLQKASAQIREKAPSASGIMSPTNNSQNIPFSDLVFDPFNDDQLDLMAQLFPLSGDDGLFWAE